jgi:hypothetical protein
VRTNSTSMGRIMPRWMCGVAIITFLATQPVCAEDAAPAGATAAPQSLKETRARELKPGETKAEAAWISIPGGIAEPSGKTAYIANASDGVEAIDLANGQVIWTSKEAKYPVALFGDELIAQAPRGSTKVNTLTLVVIDTTNCSRLCFPIGSPSMAASVYHSPPPSRSMAPNYD